MAQALLARDIFMADVKKVPPENFLRQHFFCYTVQFLQILSANDRSRLERPENACAETIRVIGDQNLTFRHAGSRYFVSPQIAVYGQFLVSQCALVSDDIRSIRIEETDLAVRDDLIVLAELHEHFVEGKDRIRILLLGSHIDIAVVVRDLKPGFPGRKAGLL